MARTSRYLKLPKKIKTAWVKALRSGRYKQGTGRLGDSEGGYCCWGVLGRVCGEQFAPNSYHHPLDVPLEKLGGYKITHRLAERLAGMNDGGDAEGSGRPFSQIADWIEENL